MEEFEVQFSGITHVKAETLEQAVEAFDKLKNQMEKIEGIGVWPDQFHAQDGEATEVTGICEMCLKPIFEHQIYCSDPDGIIWHKKC